MQILMVLTSHEQLGDSCQKTGFWLEEFAAPYYVFTDGGATVTLASPKGGQPPLDPTSELPENLTAATKRFRADHTAQAQLASTKELAEVSATEFEAVFYPGGHGPLWDLAVSPTSVALLEAFAAAGKPIGAVCHGPAALTNVCGPDGEPLVRGRAVTAFSDEEEESVGRTDVVPFLVADRLRELGGVYSHGPTWAAYVQVDGPLVTGQNPASSAPAAERLLELARGVSAQPITEGR